MSTAITTPVSFEQRLKDRIKESIGELVTDEDLSKMVAASMQDVFFNKRPNPNWSSYGYNRSQPQYFPPLIHELIKSAMQDSVKGAVDAWVKDHADEVERIVKEVISVGFGNAVLRALDNKFAGDLMNLQHNIVSTINKPT